MNRGEVWWVEHPIQGRRPFLILTRQAAIPSEIALSTDDGMPADCVLNFDNLAILNKSWFSEPICRLSPVRMVEACRVLSVALGR